MLSTAPASSSTAIADKEDANRGKVDDKVRTDKDAAVPSPRLLPARRQSCNNTFPPRPGLQLCNGTAVVDGRGGGGRGGRASVRTIHIAFMGVRGIMGIGGR